MNFEDAIKTITEIKLLMSEYLKHPDNIVNAQTLSGSKQCQLGQWLQNNEQKYKNLPLFQQLVKEHENFHKAAADIVKRKEEGEVITPFSAIGAQSEYEVYSSKTISLLMQLQEQLESENS